MLSHVNHEDQEIPQAESPDLISALLSFGAVELSDAGAGLLLEKACALRRWHLWGAHPRFFVNQWVEVVLVGAEQAHCRLLNAATHVAINPLTLDALLKLIAAQLHQVESHQTAPDFAGRLLAAYDSLAEHHDEVPLHQLYLHLKRQQPAYRRESFGLDLFYALEKGLLAGRHPSLLPDDSAPRKERYALPDPQGLQWVHRLWLSPELHSLDI